jgi:biotin carboxyl carrier protein
MATEFRYQTGQAGSPVETVRIERQNQDRVYSVTVGGQSYTVRVDEILPDRISFSVEGRARCASVIADGSRRWVALDGLDGHVFLLTPASESTRHRASTHAGGEALAAAMPGQIVKVLVTQGEVVKRGQALVVLEAMKMELRVTAPDDGQVARVLCEPGQVVERGQVLLELSGV